MLVFLSFPVVEKTEIEKNIYIFISAFRNFIDLNDRKAISSGKPVIAENLLCDERVSGWLHVTHATRTGWGKRREIFTVFLFLKTELEQITIVDYEAFCRPIYSGMDCFLCRGNYKHRSSARALWGQTYCIFANTEYSTAFSLMIRSEKDVENHFKRNSHNNITCGGQLVAIIKCKFTG